MTFRHVFICGLILLTACARPAVQGVKTYSYPSGQHQPGLITYKETPAVGGAHNPAWQNCGVYAAPLYPSYVVHSLEHGAVSITYRPGISAAQLNGLGALARTRTYTLLSPFEAQPAPIILSAWGAQLSVDDASDPRVKAFLDRYEQANSAPEPGAPAPGRQHHRVKPASCSISEAEAERLSPGARNARVDSPDRGPGSSWSGGPHSSPGVLLGSKNCAHPDRRFHIFRAA